jgi:CRP-like cAMP-binding protein
MNVTRRAPHPLYGDKYELQTFKCWTCRYETERSADRNGHPHLADAAVYSETLLSQVQQTVACNSMHTTEERMCRWLLMMHDRAGGEALPYTHEFFSHILGANRKSVTLAALAMQPASSAIVGGRFRSLIARV